MRKFTKNSTLFAVFLTVMVALGSGCAYYNYLYNAKKSFSEAEKKRLEQGDEQNTSRSRSGSRDYEAVIESAGRMLEFYPDSRWEAEALLILAKAYYRSEKYRKAIVKVDELFGKYPESKFLTEGQLWKGMSLLKLSQPDSARQILLNLMTVTVNKELQAQANLALGEYYYEEERWEAAITEFRKILDSEVDAEWFRSRALILVGDCLKKLGRAKGALELYEQVLSRKQSRAFRFAASYERAMVLIDLEQYDDAMAAFKRLLRDGAFIDQFPKIKLATGICARKMGLNEEARERFEELLKDVNRGEIAARAQFELGLLLWHTSRDLKNAALAFKGVGSADRNSEYAVSADSMLARIETLSRFWQDLGFYQRQLSLIDSSFQGLREILPSETLYVDSVKIHLDQKPQRERQQGKSRRSNDDPMYRMIEEAKKAEEKEKAAKGADSLNVIAIDSTAALDSTALAAYNLSLHQRYLATNLGLANYYLFQPQSRDSAISYYSIITEHNVTDSIWGEAMTSLAFIARANQDSIAYDSLLTAIINNMPASSYLRKARLAKGLSVAEEAVDSLGLKFNDAEKLWRELKKFDEARNLYLEIASLADSASDHRARALLAAAFISIRELGQDSAAHDAYQIIVEEFKRADYGRFAKDAQMRLIPSDRVEAEADSATGGEKVLDKPEFPDDGLRNFEDFDYLPYEDRPDLDKVYRPGEVDEIPDLMTSPGILKNLLSTHYPMELMGQEIRGEVQLELVVNGYGEPEQIKIVGETPEGMGFGEAAIEVLELLEYEPGRYQGRYVSVKIKQKLVFEPI